MSTNTRWKQALALKPKPIHSQVETRLCNSIRELGGPQGLPLKRPVPTEQKPPPQKVADRVQTSTLSPTQNTNAAGHNLHSVSTSNAKAANITNWNSGCASKPASPPPCSSRFSRASILADTSSRSTAISLSFNVAPPRFSAKVDPDQRLPDPPLGKSNPRSDIVSQRIVPCEESVTSSQKYDDTSSKCKNSVTNTNTMSSLKSKWPKSGVQVDRPKHHPKPEKVRVLAKSRKRHKKRRTRTGGSKTPSSSGTSDMSGPPTETFTVKIATGQHGFYKNAATGSDSVESSFTTVNVGATEVAVESGQVAQKSRARAVGTSIPEELVARQGVYLAHPNHRSVGAQADGSQRPNCDPKTLFQRLLPRITSLGNTKRRQCSLTATSSSGSRQSCFSELLSGSASRTYHGSRSEDSASERTGGNSIDVHFEPSGNVRAVVRISSNMTNRYSSRSSTLWSRSGDRLTPIIQGVSFPRHQSSSTQQSQAVQKTTSTSSDNSRLSKKHS